MHELLKGKNCFTPVKKRNVFTRWNMDHVILIAVTTQALTAGMCTLSDINIGYGSIPVYTMGYIGRC